MRYSEEDIENMKQIADLLPQHSLGQICRALIRMAQDTNHIADLEDQIEFLTQEAQSARAMLTNKEIEWERLSSAHRREREALQRENESLKESVAEWKSRFGTIDLLVSGMSGSSKSNFEGLLKQAAYMENGRNARRHRGGYVAQHDSQNLTPDGRSQDEGLPQGHHPHPPGAMAERAGLKPEAEMHEDFVPEYPKADEAKRSLLRRPFFTRKDG